MTRDPAEMSHFWQCQTKFHVHNHWWEINIIILVWNIFHTKQRYKMLQNWIRLGLNYGLHEHIGIHNFMLNWIMAGLCWNVDLITCWDTPPVTWHQLILTHTLLVIVFSLGYIVTIQPVHMLSGRSGSMNINHNPCCYRPLDTIPFIFIWMINGNSILKYSLGLLNVY